MGVDATWDCETGARARPRLWLLVTILGCLIGIYPGAGALVAIAIAMAFVAPVLPECVAILVLLSIAISPQYIFSDYSIGLELSSIHKLIIIIGLVPYVISVGLRHRVNPMMLAYAIVLMLTFVLSARHPNLSTAQSFKSWIGLAVPWLLLDVRWKRNWVNICLISIAILPIVSVVVGFGLSVLGMHALAKAEYTGAIRLQGANIPPHLAMLAFVGVAAAAFRNREGDRIRSPVLVINFAILLATGTRGPLIAALAVVAVLIWTQLRQMTVDRVASLTRPALVGLALATAFAVYLPSLVARTVNAAAVGGLNLSGRLVAWLFFLNEGLANPWFGRGLGAGTVASAGYLTSFRVPHNEYIRTFVDGGIAGLVLVGIGLVLVHKRMRREMPIESRLVMNATWIGFLFLSLVDNTVSTNQFIIPLCWLFGVVQSMGGEADSGRNVKPLTTTTDMP